MIVQLRLYSTAIVLAVWAALSFAGIHSETLKGSMLTLLAISVIVHVRQLLALKKEHDKEKNVH